MIEETAKDFSDLFPWLLLSVAPVIPFSFLAYYCQKHIKTHLVVCAIAGISVLILMEIFVIPKALAITPDRTSTDALFNIMPFIAFAFVLLAILGKTQLREEPDA